MSLFSFYVVEYPSETARLGTVLWKTGTNDRQEAQKRCESIQASNPWKDYEVSDLTKG